MNKTAIGIVVGLVLGSGATWFLLRPAGESAPSKPEPATANAAEKLNPLRLPPARREQAGIRLAAPAATTLAPEVQGFGRVLDPGTLATGVAEIETARAARAASEKELERARKLFTAGGNASAQAVETAEAAAARDRAALTSAQARLAAAWGREVARNVAPLAEALQQGASLVRIDVLPGESPSPTAREARVALPGRTDSFAAEIIGPTPVADAQVQGLGFLALVRQPPLPAGAALRVTLPGTGEPRRVLVVPRDAIVYHQGSAWVFALEKGDAFERKLVTLGRSVGADGVAVLSGLESDDSIATSGAQQLLAAELQASGAAEP